MHGVPSKRFEGGLRKALLAQLTVVVVAAIGACDQSLPNVPSKVYLPEPTIVSGPDKDRTMGTLSDVAQHIAAALQDPRMRGLVVRALRDTVKNATGMNLSDCAQGTVAGDLFSAGESRGGQRAAALCERMHTGRGMVLYMDHTRLAGWDSTTIPIVTAVADPDKPVEKSFHGYQTPGTVIELKADGSVGGPVLIVLPFAHPRTAASSRATLVRTEELHQPSASASRTSQTNAP